jgi:hypothetical protein
MDEPLLNKVVGTFFKIKKKSSFYLNYYLLAGFVRRWRRRS